jgi:hypothetical protein
MHSHPFFDSKCHLRGPRAVTKLSRTLILGCSILALSACGPEEIVSPGTGGNITINNPPAPAPTPTPTPTSTLVTAANGCPTIADPQGLKDEGTITGPEGTWRVCVLPSRINVSSRLSRIPGLLYALPGRVDVGTDQGAASTNTAVTLTVDPGVIVFASGAAFLNVNRGNRINAAGTAALPIVFTSRDNVLGINTDNSSGQWGGIVLSGRAPVTDCIAPGATPGTVACERQVEGAVDPALFGGASPADNSGTLRYVQIRYSGFVLSGNSELQSLTTGGVGSGTTLSHIQSVNSSDDGVEFFGGLVNIKNLIVAGAEDDGLDTDVGVKANMQYVLVAQRTGAGDTAIEHDSSNGLEDSLPRSNVKLANATLIQRNTLDQVIRIRGGGDYTIANSVVVDQSTGTACLRVDDDETIRAANAGLQDDGAPVFSSVAFQCSVKSRNGSNGGATAVQAEAFVTGGTGNNFAYTNTLTSAFLAGANETGFSPIFNVALLGSYFAATTYIGALSTTNNWATGWTCDSVAASFGSNTGSCLRIPVFS